MIKKFYVEDNFTKIPNEYFELDISAGALRVLLYLFSRPDDWSVFNKKIMKECFIKKQDTLTGYLKELLDKNIIKRTVITDQFDGVIGTYDYEFLMLPKNGGRYTQKTVVGIPENGGGGIPENGVSPKMGEHNNTNLSNKTNTNKTTTPVADAPSVDICDDGFDKFWKGYELDVIVHQIGRPAGSKAEAKKLFAKLRKSKVSNEAIEEYINKHYENTSDIKYLRSLRKLLADVDGMKEIEKELKNEND